MIKTRLYATIQKELGNQLHILYKDIDLPIPPFLGFVIASNVLGDLIVKNIYYNYDSKLLVCNLEPVYCDTEKELDEWKMNYLNYGRQ